VKAQQKRKWGGIQMHGGTEDVLPLGALNGGGGRRRKRIPQTSNGDERQCRGKDHGAVLEGGMALSC